MQTNFLKLLCVLLLVSSCSKQNNSQTASQSEKYSTIGKVERISEEINQIIKADAKIEIVAKGFKWSEGPLWLPKEQKVIFSDVPMNTIYEWTEKDSIKVYLTPSGYTSDEPREGEVGSNGLSLDNEGYLVLCQHGNKQIARMKSPTAEPKPDFETLANRFEEQRFDSPNDLCISSKGEIFFTDPPYGLPKKDKDPEKEIPFQGVYKIGVDGMVTLLTKELERPNGLVLSKDEKTLYVANSFPERAIWMKYQIKEDGSLSEGVVLYDATSLVGKENGLPDGMKVDQKGNIFATGPGGVWVFSKEEKLLGKIKTEEPASNCALADDGKTLYITSNMNFLRVELKD